MIPMTRRRFLTVSAAALAAGQALAATGDAAVWQGRALGAEARITLAGAGGAEARAAFREVAHVLAALEARWSLFAESDLVRLNRTGILANPTPEVLALFDLAGRVHDATGGVFDPTVQPLWLALAAGGDSSAARHLIGWNRVAVTPEAIRLEPGMGLTFNGIAQGAAADAVAGVLLRRGFGNVLVDVGEQVALGERPGGGPWQAEIALPDGQQVSRAELAGIALATSSPLGTRLPGGQGHILDPRTGLTATARRLVSVMAPQAAVADALSTAFCAMDDESIRTALGRFSGARLAAVV